MRVIHIVVILLFLAFLAGDPLSLIVDPRNAATENWRMLSGMIQPGG